MSEVASIDLKTHLNMNRSPCPDFVRTVGWIQEPAQLGVILHTKRPILYTVKTSCPGMRLISEGKKQQSFDMPETPEGRLFSGEGGWRDGICGNQIRLVAPAGCSYDQAMYIRNFLLSAGLLTLSLSSLGNGEELKSGRPCTFDPDRPNVPDCLESGDAGHLFVSGNYLRQLKFDRFGLAPVYTREDGWMYVDRRGRVVVSGVAEMDNWADSFHDGLVRVLKNGKYGFANRKGSIVIAPVYEGALNFNNGTAEVCRSCHCDSRSAEHCALTGGEWFRIDTRGRVVARLKPQS